MIRQLSLFPDNIPGPHHPPSITPTPKILHQILITTSPFCPANPAWSGSAVQMLPSRLEDVLAEARKVLYQRGFDIIRPIGDGGFATVYLIKSRQYSNPDSDFVVKLIDLALDESHSLMNSFKAEIGALTKLCHPHVIQIFDYFTSKTLLYMILEYCPNGCVKDVIATQGAIQSPYVGQLFRGIVAALGLCHSEGIAHRDIKPSNILLDKYGRAKLADFGLAQYFKPDGQLSRMFAGSLPYLAPEVISKHPYDPLRADIWSLGVTFYEMLTGKLPWDGIEPDQILQEISEKIDTIAVGLDPTWSPIVNAMLQINPAKRCTCAELEANPAIRAAAGRRLSDAKRMRTRNMNSQSRVQAVPASFLLNRKAVTSRRSGRYKTGSVALSDMKMTFGDTGSTESAGSCDDVYK